MKKSRTYYAKKNTKLSLLNRIVTIVCNFLCRSAFINVLGNEYLGAGSMFGNVFSVLSLCELGFGAAASQSLYKPLAEENTTEITAVVRYYEKIYRYVSFITITLAAAVLPFLPHFFKDIVKIENYRAVFLIFTVHEVLSYHFAPFRSVIMCDQKMYAVMGIRTVSILFMTVFQIAFLYLTPSYLVYIFLRIFFLAADGFACKAYAKKYYPYLFIIKGVYPDAFYKRKIWRNTKALIVHRIGGVINTSTDSILISSYLGLAHMGNFSNYSLIINSLGSFISLAINSVSAGIGNLGVTENSEKSIKVLEKLSFLCFAMMTVCTAVLTCTINPLIALWIGDDKCFKMAETVVILACFYISYIRDPVQTYLHAYGVFKSTGKLYLIRGICNLILSLVFVKRYGAVGVFAGTFVSSVITVFPFEPYFLFKYAFNKSCKSFMKKYTFYLFHSFAVCALSFVMTSKMPGSFMWILIRGAFATSVSVIYIGFVYGGKGLNSLAKSLSKKSVILQKNKSKCQNYLLF